MCSARLLIVLYSCVEFHENISNGIRVMEWTIFNVKRAMTPELRFVCSALICVKFYKNISNDTSVMERTQNYEALTNGRTLKSSDGIT